jgi:hypothetical protein
MAAGAGKLNRERFVMPIEIRAAEPGDYEGMRQLLAGPKAVWGTRQLPFPSSELWRKRLAETVHGDYRLVASMQEKLVGQLTLHTFPSYTATVHMRHRVNCRRAKQLTVILAAVDFTNQAVKTRKMMDNNHYHCKD